MTPRSSSLRSVARRALAAAPKALAALVAAHLCAGAALAESGNLDASFGIGGMVVINTSGNVPATTDSDRAEGLVVQTLAPNAGKLVVAVESKNPATNRTETCLIRYDTNGTIDPSFGAAGTGIVRYSFSTGGAGDWVNTAALQADGKIVVSGAVTNPRGVFNMMAVRFSAEGVLDPSFGPGGLVVVAFSKSSGAAGLAIQSDGCIVLAGETGGKYAVARLLPDGALDPNFGSGGKVNIAPYRRSTGGVSAAAIQWVGSEERILVSGSCRPSPSGQYDFGVSRFTSSGALDPSFGNHGTVVTDFFGYADQSSGLRVDTNAASTTYNFIVLAGTAQLGGTGDYAAAAVRYTPDGDLDTDFADAGKFTWNYGAGRERGYDVVLQADGGIVIAGSANAAIVGAEETMVIRLTGSGILDDTFGAVITSVASGGNERATTVALQTVVVGDVSHDRIVVCGTANRDGGYNVTLLRYEE
jgi:uncharacterized delta-60 repeat protein